MEKNFEPHQLTLHKTIFRQHNCTNQKIRNLMLSAFYIRCNVQSKIPNINGILCEKKRRRFMFIVHPSIFLCKKNLWEKEKKNAAYNGILLPKLFWPTARKKCSSYPEYFLKFEAEDREFAKILRLLEQLIQTVKG